MMYTTSHNNKASTENKKEDAVLVKAAQVDLQHFDILYKKYRGKILNYFFYRVGRNQDTAEEMTQETFLKAFKALPHFSIQDCSYLAYLLRIAHNLLVNYYRSSKPVLMENLPDVGTTTMGNEIGAKLEVEQVWKEIDRFLTKAEGKAMHLKYQKDWAVKDIAHDMGRSANAIKLLLSHGRKKIRHVEEEFK